MSTAKARSAHAKAILGAELFEKLAHTNVLLVGAGGIGCELLKNIVLTGFGKITLLDLDTIDISNLNRQFLFRKKDVKQSKALVAAQTAAPFNPNVRITPIHDNIKEPQYDVQWFKQFDIVLNALDNLDARRHVNKMCMAAQVPLVESGTAGYLGQVQPLLKDQTECFDCIPKPTPKTFPVCTIRSTPSQPIHCIVWSKSYLMGQLFGEDENESASEELNQAEKDGENAQEIATLRKEAEAFRAVRDALRSPESADAAKLVFEKVFNSDIKNLLSMSDMWKSRAPPTPLEYDAILDGSFEKTRANANGNATSTPVVASKDGNAVASSSKVPSAQTNGASSGHASANKAALKDQRSLSLKDNLELFISSTNRLAARLRTGNEPTISFDKDDDDTLDFVTAASNLRSYAYGIDGKTRWEVKEMAGNIIPAIATTNAIISGLIVLQALHVLRLKLKSSTTSSTSLPSASPSKSSRGSGTSQALSNLRNVHIQFKPSVPLSTIRLSGPNPECGVCRDVYVVLQCDTTRTTLGEVVKAVVGDAPEDDADMMEEDGPKPGREVAVYESQRVLCDPDWDDNLERTLESLNVTKGKFLSIVDEDGEWSTITLAICDLPPNHPADGPSFILPSSLPKLSKKYKPVKPRAETPPMTGTKRRRSPVVDDDGVIDIEPSPVKKKARTDDNGSGELGKRKMTASEGGPSPNKRRRLGLELEEEGLVILDDANEQVDMQTEETAIKNGVPEDVDVIVIEDD
ncbi:hypothetical protein CPC08DRAFT_712628 [Agrocybe pediades]|nr:hypothetical protein CPC08DRAFT_712628 [Agrocybe pediades]